mmetsp:Transcript_25779/g.82693  ORF Transcript_25779/g.82693 Transcript_25779/m.82693 type:complete len:370 (-) Transcript_25779:39-1148(-)
MRTLFLSRVSPVRLVSAESAESVSPSVFSSASSFSSPTSDIGVKASPPLLLPPLLLRRRGQPRYATAPSSARSLCAATNSDVQRSSSRMAEATPAEIGPDAARASMAVRTAACAVTTERRNSASSTQPAVVTPSPLSLVTEAETETEQDPSSGRSRFKPTIDRGAHGAAGAEVAEAEAAAHEGEKGAAAAAAAVRRASSALSCSAAAGTSVPFETRSSSVPPSSVQWDGRAANAPSAGSRSGSRRRRRGGPLHFAVWLHSRKRAGPSAGSLLHTPSPLPFLIIATCSAVSARTRDRGSRIPPARQEGQNLFLKWPGFCGRWKSNEQGAVSPSSGPQQPPPHTAGDTGPSASTPPTSSGRMTSSASSSIA